jgi:hypothetical protein
MPDVFLQGAILMSATYIHCPVCKGRKRMLGLGLIEKDCSECKGVGFVEKPILSTRIHEEDEISDLKIDWANQPLRLQPDFSIHPTEDEMKKAEIENAKPKRKGRPAKVK